MSSTLTGLLVFTCTFGAAILGILLRARLPAHHLDGDSKDSVKLVIGLIATMAALVLGLLISSAHTAYDAQEAEIQQLGVHLYPTRSHSRALRFTGDGSTRPAA